jgi:hypothetical protein
MIVYDMMRHEWDWSWCIWVGYWSGAIVQVAWKALLDRHCIFAHLVLTGKSCTGACDVAGRFRFLFFRRMARFPMWSNRTAPAPQQDHVYDYNTNQSTYALHLSIYLPRSRHPPNHRTHTDLLARGPRYSPTQYTVNPPMSSEASSSTNSIDTHARRNEMTPEGSKASTPFATRVGNYLLYPAPRPVFARHYASLLDHAEHFYGTEASGDHDGLTPRQGSRREGFTWDPTPVKEDTHTYSRNPLPPEQSGFRTPPPLEEILRTTTIDDADNLHNATVFRSDTAESHSLHTHLSSSTTFNNRSSCDDTRRSSIAGFAKGLAKHVPDMRIFAPPEALTEHTNDDTRRDSGAASSDNSTRASRIERRLSFVLRPSLKRTTSTEKAAHPSPVIEEPIRESCVKTQTSQQHATGTLRDRRKVKLDLALPVDMPGLSARNRSPVGPLASITPSRPRSPKTPWIRDEPPKWQHDPGHRTVPIIEDYIGEMTMELGDARGPAILPAILPGDDYIHSSQSPKLERPIPKMRDRGLITQARLNRNRSGRGTSESEVGQTPTGNWVPYDRVPERTWTEAEVDRHGHESQRARSRR